MLCHAAASYNRLGVFNNPKDSREALLDGLDSWAAEMDSAHEEAASAAAAADPAEADHQLPPVRGQGGIATKPTPTQEAKPAAAGVRKTPQKSGKSIPGGDFRAWDKYDVSKALDEMDADDLHPPKVEEVADDEAEGGGSGGGSDRTVVNTRKMPSAKISSKPKTDAQCQQMATNEKEKGNEAFRAGDFEEAVVYYSRSIDAWPTAAVYNNRALTNLKMKRYLKTIEDTKVVLKQEPGNFKAHVRQANAYKESNRGQEALVAVGHALALKPTSKEALALKTALMKKTDPAPKKKKRMLIEEDGNDENDKDPKKGGAEEEDAQEEDGEYDPDAAFHRASKFKGSRPGYVFRMSEQGLGYYKDAVEVAKREAVKLPKEVKPIKRVMIEEDSDDSSDDEDEGADEESTPTSTSAESAASSSPSASSSSSSSRAKSPLSSLSSSSSSTTSGSTPRRVIVEDDSDDSSDDDSSDKATEEDTSSSSVPIAPATQPPVQAPAPAAAALAKTESELEKPVPAAVLALKDAGKTRFLAGQYGEAAVEYGNALDRLAKEGQRESSMGVILLSNQAACYTKTGECRKAVEACDTALAIGGSDAKILLRRANANEVLERWKKAFLDYKMVLAMLPGNPAANAGVARAKKGIEFDQDFEFLKEQRGVVPKLAAARFDGGGVSVGTPPAKKKAAPGKSSRPDVHPSKSKATSTATSKPNGNGNANVKSAGKERAAASSASSASSALNSAALAYDELKAKGNKFVGKKKFAEAVECYSRCVELDGSKAAAYNNRSLCYLRLKKWDLAKADVEKVLSIEPQNAKALLRLAQAYGGMGAYSEGDAAYKALLAVDPKNAKAVKEREELKVEGINAQLAAIKKQREEIEAQRMEAHAQVAALAKSTEEVSVTVTKKKSELEVKEEELEQASSGIDAGLASMKEMLEDEVEIAQIEEKVKAAKAAAESKALDAKEKVKQAVDAATVASGSSTKTPAKKKAATKKKASPTKKRAGSPTKAKAKGDALAFMTTLEQLAPKPAALSEYLGSIPTDVIPAMISNRLEADHLVAILKAAEFLEPANGFAMLKVLTTVPRFDMATMFLADPDRAVAAATFAKIKAAAELGEMPSVSGAEVATIASKYD